MARKSKNQPDPQAPPRVAAPATAPAPAPAPELPAVARPPADAPDAAELKTALLVDVETKPLITHLTPDRSDRAPVIRIAIGIPATLAANLQLVAVGEETVGAVLVHLGELFWRHYPVLASHPNGKAVVLAGEDLDRAAAVMGRTPDHGSEVADVMEAIATYEVSGHKLLLPVDTLDAIAAQDPSGSGKLTAEELLPRIVQGGIRLFLQGDLDLTADGLPFDIPAGDSDDEDPPEAGG